MTNGQGTGGLALPIENHGKPAILGEWATTGTSTTQTYHNAGGLQAILLGVDWTATNANPVQCFAHLTYQPSGATFFWDSQSTGEGNGVRWQWRGALPIPVGYGVDCVTTASATIVLCGVMWGVILDTYVYAYD